MIHTDAFPLAGQTVNLAGGRTVLVEDWADRLFLGQSWRDCMAPVAVAYGVLARALGLPLDDEVLYVKADGQAGLVHITQLAGASIRLPLPPDPGAPHAPEPNPPTGERS